MESFRTSVLEKKYMKFFALAILLLATGVILLGVARLFNLYADPSSPDEYEFALKFLGTISYLSMLLLQLGLVVFCFSSFWGAVADGTLSEHVRRGMVSTASIAIIALALLMTFGNIIIL